jgi:hypothetical protein
LKNPITKKGLAEWLKVKALNSNPSTKKKIYSLNANHCFRRTFNEKFSEKNASRQSRISKVRYHMV